MIVTSIAITLQMWVYRYKLDDSNIYSIHRIILCYELSTTMSQPLVTRSGVGYSTALPSFPLTPPFFSCLPYLLLLFSVLDCFRSLAAFVVVVRSLARFPLRTGMPVSHKCPWPCSLVFLRFTGLLSPAQLLSTRSLRPVLFDVLMMMMIHVRITKRSQWEHRKARMRILLNVHKPVLDISPDIIGPTARNSSSKFVEQRCNTEL